MMDNGHHGVSICPLVHFPFFIEIYEQKMDRVDTKSDIQRTLFTYKMTH